jgi:glycosyltransferase involved in cell wall biosynthesis
MKLLQLFNEYRSRCGGEPAVVRMTEELVKKHGGETMTLTRSSQGVQSTFAGKVKAFVSGMYSQSAYREMARVLDEYRPDVVHVHNLYPLFSPSVLVACRHAGVPVVMSNHNYVLTCPITTHLSKGRVCEKCVGGWEHWCVLKNCRDNWLESLAYASRSIVARKLRLFHDNVTVFLVLSRFAKQRLMQAGFAAERIAVLPNMVAIPAPRDAEFSGRYAAFSGRMSAEKGIDTLLAAAARLPDVHVELAGDGPLLDELSGQAPPNAVFRHRLAPGQMAEFYRQARFLVVPSRWFEGCPLVISEAMSHGLPVIASRLGGMTEMVEDNVTGLLHAPDDAEDLARKIGLLWNDREMCLRMGQAGRAKAVREYHEESYYRRLTAIYETAIEIQARRARESGKLAGAGASPCPAPRA